MGIDSKLRGMDNEDSWVDLLVGGWVIFEYLAWFSMDLDLITLRIASALANTYYSNSSLESSCVGSIIVSVSRMNYFGSLGSLSDWFLILTMIR